MRPAELGVHAPVAGLRVLVVEDDMILAMMVEDFLVDLGCVVAGVEMRLAGGIEAARGSALDAAVLDINLNGEESFPIADVLAARAVPFVFATGYSAALLPERFAGAVVLGKPFDARELAAALSRVQAG